MATPKVFEIVFKTEVEAADFETAVAEARNRISAKSLHGVTVKHGVIRDDDLFDESKDFISRHTNHVAVLNPTERQELENIIGTLASSTAGVSDEERNRLHNRAINILSWQGG